MRCLEMVYTIATGKGGPVFGTGGVGTTEMCNAADHSSRVGFNLDWMRCKHSILPMLRLTRHTSPLVQRHHLHPPRPIPKHQGVTTHATVAKAVAIAKTGNAVPAPAAKAKVASFGGGTAIAYNATQAAVVPANLAAYDAAVSAVAKASVPAVAARPIYQAKNKTLLGLTSCSGLGTSACQMQITQALPRR